jgi:hypothetical protein
VVNRHFSAALSTLLTRTVSRFARFWEQGDIELAQTK